MTRTASKAAALCRVLPQAAEAPEWIELLPGRAIEGIDGRRFVFGDPAGVLAKFRARTTDLVLDWEHASELLAPEGYPAPAAGWVRELELRGEALWGRVDWTSRGAASVTSREYRYVSPAFLHTNDGSITELVSVGLTNKPNLDLAALNRVEDHRMDPELLKLLGLTNPNATAPDVIAAVKAMQGDLQLAKNRAEATPSLEKFVPRADYELALNRVKAAEQRLADAAKAEVEREIETLVSSATADGKITPATAEYYRAACRQEGGLALFRAFLEKAPKIADATLPAKPPAAGTGSELSETQLAICRDLGLTPESFKKTTI